MSDIHFSPNQLSDLRAKCLAISDPLELAEIHGWLVGLVVAIERKRGARFSQQDALIADLRASEPPLHRFESNPHDPSRCLTCGNLYTRCPGSLGNQIIKAARDAR